MSELHTVTQETLAVQLPLNVIRTSSPNPLDSSADLKITTFFFLPLFSPFTISLDAAVFGSEEGDEII